jgi:hypothetical protein
MTQLLVPGPERKKKRNGPGAAEYHLQVELTRLKRSNVTGRAALETAIAVWMLSLEQPAVLPDDERLTFAMAGAVLKLARYDGYTYFDNQSGKVIKFNTKHPGAGPKNLLGSRIRTLLASFAVNVETALREERDVENRRRLALRTPITITTTEEEADVFKKKIKPVAERVARPEVHPKQPVRIETTPSQPSVVRRLVVRGGRAVRQS